MKEINPQPNINKDLCRNMPPEEITVEKAARAMARLYYTRHGSFEQIDKTVDEMWKHFVDEARAALEAIAPDLTAAARAEGMEEAARLQPPTAEDPNETAYQRGRFDGIIEFGTAIHTRAREIRSSLKPKATGEQSP